MSVSEELKWEETSDGEVRITAYTGEDEEVSIPPEIDGKKVAAIGEKAFSECKKLRKVTVPAGVSEISPLSFDRCGSLERIDVSEDNEVFSSEDGVAFLLDECGDKELFIFPAGRKEREYTIPDDVDGICAFAFSGCTGLTHIIIPDSVKGIGVASFMGCNSLTELTLPDSVIKIEDHAFSGCTSLTNVTIPDSVETIGSSVFERCDPVTITYRGKSYKCDEFAEEFNVENPWS